MSIKRDIRLGVAAVLAFGFVAACNNKSSDESKTSAYGDGSANARAANQITVMNEVFGYYISDVRVDGQQVVKVDIQPGKTATIPRARGSVELALQQIPGSERDADVDAALASIKYIISTNSVAGLQSQLAQTNWISAKYDVDSKSVKIVASAGGGGGDDGSGGGDGGGNNRGAGNRYGGGGGGGFYGDW